MNTISESLIENSKSAIIACVELHNKPLFRFRYEVCVILAINGWELLLKAFIAENCPEIKLIRKDGTSKPFEECVTFVSGNLGKEFRVIQENLDKLYKYRCQIIHFYKDSIETILYSLLHKSIIFYNKFLRTHFNIDLADETNLVLLPIGFKPFATPVDFLSRQSTLQESSNMVQNFVKSIIESTEQLSNEGIEESILTGYNIAVMNENRISNADIIAGITKNEAESSLTIVNVLGNIKVTNDESAKKVSIEEESLFKTVYTLQFCDVVQKARELFPDFKQNAKFNQIMQKLKENPTFHKKRYLDIANKTGIGKDYYTLDVLNELKKHYGVSEIEREITN